MSNSATPGTVAHQAPLSMGLGAQKEEFSSCAESQEEVQKVPESVLFKKKKKKKKKKTCIVSDLKKGLGKNSNT